MGKPGSQRHCPIKWPLSLSLLGDPGCRAPGPEPLSRAASGLADGFPGGSAPERGPPPTVLHPSATLPTILAAVPASREHGSVGSVLGATNKVDCRTYSVLSPVAPGCYLATVYADISMVTVSHGVSWGFSHLLHATRYETETEIFSTRFPSPGCRLECLFSYLVPRRPPWSCGPHSSP
jgi:hypothetical protein